MLKVEGLTKCMSDPDTIDDIKLLCLKRLPTLESTPEMRLGKKFFTTAYFLHDYNSKLEAEEAKKKAGEINNKFQDI